MKKAFQDYKDEQEILEELAQRAADGGDEEKECNYTDDVNWLIGKLISESEMANDGLLKNLNLDSIQEPSDLRTIAATLKTLCSYATAKASAVELRASGRVADAMDFERDAQVLYNRLPAWARW